MSSTSEMELGNTPSERTEPMEAKIRSRLEELRGMLQADGGDLEIVGIKDKTVSLKLKGACGCCPHASVTIKSGIERILREEIDKEIVVEQAK